MRGTRYALLRWPVWRAGTQQYTNADWSVVQNIIGADRRGEGENNELHASAQIGGEERMMSVDEYGSSHECSTASMHQTRTHLPIEAGSSISNFDVFVR
jgi:hypothetical protein